MHHEVGVVIPYYTNELKIAERISLEQCVRILGHYPIIFVVPDNMSEEDYPTVSDAIFEKVPREWLRDVKAYNQMMMNEEFYQFFEEYTYILVYQLDAFVFSDRLSEMCQYGYDYIGAPWLSSYFYYINADKCIWRVGNGGFSLRKVKSVIALLKREKQNGFIKNEDLFFAVSDSEEFKVAPLEIALKFSFETEVKRCFELNKGELPFGCHAWTRYAFRFWQPNIETFGYDTSSITVDSGNEDEELHDIYIEQEKTAFFWEKIYNRDWLQKELAKLFSKQVENYFIWGVGRYGEKLCKIFIDAKLPIKGLVDNNKKLIGKTKWGYEIKSINEINFSKNNAFIIAIREGEKVAEQLELYGYARGVDYILLDDLKSIINIPYW